MLEPYRRIACFIDQDVASEAAVAEARRLRDSCGADLFLVHVAPEPLALSTGPYAYLAVSEDYMADAREWIESRARQEDATAVLLSGPAGRAPRSVVSSLSPARAGFPTCMSPTPTDGRSPAT